MGIYDRDYYQEDDLRPIRPWDSKSMVTLLIIANVALFVANFLFTSASGNLTRFLSLSPQDLESPVGWFRLVTYGFAHLNLLHILFNMVSLYFLGQGVENKLGKWEFFRFYMLTIVLCGLVWALMRMGATAPIPVLLGASGAVTAVAMLFVYSFPHATLMLYGVVPVKAWVMGVLIIVLNVLGGRDGVAYDVHLMGAAIATVYFFGKLNFGAAGQLFSGWKTSWKQRQRGLKVHREDSSDRSVATKEEMESDRILDKIHREGQESLTARERAFLERYSRDMRRRRSGGN